jgi:hypothetical protein
MSWDMRLFAVSEEVAGSEGTKFLAVGFSGQLCGSEAALPSTTAEYAGPFSCWLLWAAYPPLAAEVGLGAERLVTGSAETSSPNWLAFLLFATCCRWVNATTLFSLFAASFPQLSEEN